MEINRAIDSQKREQSPTSAKEYANERPSKKPRLYGENPLAKSLEIKKKPKLSKRARQKLLHFEPGSPDDVLWRDVREILGKDVVDDAIEREVDLESPVSFGDEFDLEVIDLSSNGESIAKLPGDHPPNWAIVTPFALPGELIRVKISRNARMLSHADLLDIVRPNTSLRDMTRVNCQYFGTCAGCQYQMLDYPTQLEFKRRVVNKAYHNFSGLQPSLVPPALPTIGSPKIYGYRTKITPHFDAPPATEKRRKDWQVWIGFDTKGRRKVLDIEECPIATPVLNKAFGPIREEVQNKIDTYKRAATLLMRDSILPVGQEPGVTPPIVHSEDGEAHICIRDHKAIVRERVGTTLFEFPANSFFQNNNSVLVPLTEYVRDVILSREDEEAMETPSERRSTHLVDTYCGSGLFAITLLPYFARVAGIEISEESIRYARHNLKLNNIPDDRCMFRAGQAENIFDVVQDFPPEKTVVVIDPPRKGCDDKFIEQLLTFGPQTVVYVSCNVHTQARDVGRIMKTGGYRLESVRGFDLFPQTAHVESVAVLRKTLSLSTEDDEK